MPRAGRAPSGCRGTTIFSRYRACDVVVRPGQPARARRARGRRCSGRHRPRGRRGWRRPAARRSRRGCPAAGSGSSMGRWVWVPLVGDDRDVLAGVEAEPGDHPVDQVDVVARQHPEVVARPYDDARRQRDLEVTGRPGGGGAVAGVDQLPVAARTCAGLAVVGHDHRVGQLPVGQRDREPGTTGRRPPRPRPAGPGPRPGRSRGRRTRHRYCRVEVAAASPSPRGYTRCAPCASSCASIRVGTAW